MGGHCKKKVDTWGSPLGPTQFLVLGSGPTLQRQTECIRASARLRPGPGSETNREIERERERERERVREREREKLYERGL